MGPALAKINGIVCAQHWSQNILPIILYGPRAGLNQLSHGPSTGPKICYRLSCMGPALPPKYGADGLVWAQHLLQNIQPIILYGPSTGHKIYCRLPCMGPELASTDCLAWAQHWSQHLLPKTLYGPSTGPKICYRLSCMGPALPPKYGADGLVWAQHSLQNIQPIISYGPRTVLKI